MIDRLEYDAGTLGDTNLNKLRAEVTELENATDPDVDPSTKRMCRRIACEVDLLLEEANRLGVDL